MTRSGSHRRRLLAAGLLVAGLATGCGRAASAPRARSGPPTATATAAAARRATDYLVGAQNRDGGYGPAPGQASDPLFTGWAALGLASAGIDVGRLQRRGPSLLVAIERGAGRDTGSLERTILAVRAAGLSPRAAGVLGPVATLLRRVRADGSLADQANLTAFGILALRAARATPPAATLRWLIAQPDADGGFGFGPRGGTSDPDDTGAVLEALARDPAAAAVRARAVGYLRRIQDRDGGFASAPGSGSNAQSTAWAVQGLLAAGVDPAGVRVPGGPSPLTYLTRLTARDGRVSYARGLVQTPVWVTSEALMALERRPLPIG